MATIKIKRTIEWVNMARNYKIFIDGHFVGKLANGASEEFPITTGKHTVTAKIDWCSSPNLFFDIGINEIKHLTVSGFKYSWLMFLGFGTIAFFPLLKRIGGLGYAAFILLPIFLLSVYYITIGRKKYLTLCETTSEDCSR